MTKCELNQIFLGEIASVQNYGAFIRIPGTSQQGLIHRSQVSTAHVDNVAEVLQKGERVWCKVISVGEDGKVGLSMKHVNQGNGTDLDPNGVELQRDAQRKRNPGMTQHKAIQLEAVLNTTCTKCGTKGHLSKDCFMSPDGKKYELIPEIEEESVPEPDSKNIEKKAEKKHKSKKKKKKSKRSKQSTDNGDTEDKEISKRKKKKFSKERKKHKKKYNSSSSDSSDSSSSDDLKSHKRKHPDTHETRTKKCKHSKTKHSN
ncbi:PREDICTED: nucleolar protein of 40 kDa-like [Cyphomyrmex costatus]|uniref:Nucleolar protein of 40 kDa n=1 Tax=Cyphomyrmex costatus TaxID=456900 RepID=A0A195CR49_9HYME|nr:PREDICTED: nucleolar protein of 40 kDa-like [Cyphomyrmex costatus]KYN02967.1 Nucleolar protein of 40 kDa [Cyphomyrmex costatus]